MRPRIIAVIAAISLLSSAGVASANTEEPDPRADTLFSFGYDAQAQLFLYGVEPIESSEPDCILENGALATTYGGQEDDGIPVDVAGFDCGISAFSIGAQGHINHGQFMKLFHETFDMRGRGCLNRALAQSELGKDAQQVKTEDFEAATIGETGSVEFTTAYATCEHGKKDKPEDHPGKGHAKLGTETDDGGDKGKGRPKSPGKSGEAPGKNK